MTEPLRLIPTPPAIIEQRDQHLVALEEQITQADSDGIFARWLSGQELLRERVGKQLPRGRLDQLAAKLGRSRSELKARMRFAVDFPTESEVANAVSHFGSWHEIANRPREQKPPAKPELVPPPLGLPLRIAYADPPYPGQANKHYGDQPSYAGEVDHAELVHRLVTEYDGYCLHTSSSALADVLARFQIETNDMPRVMAWVKPFAAFKRNVSVAYAWEPVLVRAARTPIVTGDMVYRDWISEPITLKRGLVGVKPTRVCWWLFGVMGCQPDDEFNDLYPGTGAVTKAWRHWQRELTAA